MATWRCEISLLALKNISRVSAANEILSSTREEKSRISTLRWPTTVAAKSFYSRQNQFRDGKINFITAKSISPRRSQFHHGKINFTIRQNQFHHGKIIFIHGKINFTAAKSFSSTAKYISPRQNNFG